MTFVTDSKAKAGRYAAVFHIAGCPWYVCTDAGFVNELDTSTSSLTDTQVRDIRRTLFGNLSGASGTVPTTEYASDFVVGAPGLSTNLGKQTVKYHEIKGLTGGEWSVSFSRNANAANYDNVRSTAVNGIFDGLDITPDPAYSGVYTMGRLSAIYKDSTTDLKWTDDQGLAANLTAAIAANDIAFVWCGSTCIAIREAPSYSGGVYTVDNAKAFTGAFRSSREHLFPADENGAAVYIYAQPTLGIEGLPANLWLVRLNEDGSISGVDTATPGDPDTYLQPILFRTGPVALNSRGGPENWEINCKHWTSWMDANIRTGVPSGNLSGIRLTREPSTVSPQVQAAHMVIREWTGSAYANREIWLCAAGGAVSFNNRAEMLTAIQVEVANPSFGSSTLTQDYQWDANSFGMIGASPSGNLSYCDGVIPWVMNWGLPNFDLLTWIIPEDFIIESLPYWEVWDKLIATASKPGLARLVQSDIEDNPSSSYTYEQMDYYYQYNWDSDSTAEDFHVYDTTWGYYLGSELIEGWPIPYDSINTSYQINLTTDSDATLFSDGERFVIGTGDKAVESVVKSTGVNYIEPQDSAGYTWDSIPSMDRTPETQAGSPVANGVNKPFFKIGWPTSMYYLRGTNEDTVVPDPWPVTQPMESTTDTLEKVIRGMLGDDTNGANMPERARLWWVPDVYENLDFRELVDWDALAALSDGMFPNSTITIPMSGNETVSTLFYNALLSHGIRPTWGYSEAQRAYRMSFEPFGVVSEVDATMEGKTITDDDIMAISSTLTRGGTWIAKDIDASLNYNGEGESKLKLAISNDTGKAASAGKGKLSIKDRLLHLDMSGMVSLGPCDVDVYKNNMLSMLGHLNQTPTSVDVTLTSAALPMVEVGSSSVITSDIPWDIYEGAQGLNKKGALVVSSTIGFSDDKLSIKVGLRTSKYATGGWSPSMRIPGNGGEDVYQALSGTTLTLTNLPTTAATSEFVDPNGGQTDLSSMGCFSFNDAVGVLEERDCECTDGYAVRIFIEGASSYATSGGSQNVWTGILNGTTTDMLTLANVAAGTCKIELESANNFGITDDKIVIFMPRTTAALQPCQEIFGYLGDATGRTEDSAGDPQPAMSWI